MIDLSVNQSPARLREIAYETLQDLLDYLTFLESLSMRSGDLIQQNVIPNEFYPEFAKLIDGLSTFTEAVTYVKKVLKIGLLPPVNVLEADLLSILKDILSSQQDGHNNYVQELLKDHLPKNLQQWRNEGIPLLMRSRDS